MTDGNARTPVGAAWPVPADAWSDSSARAVLQLMVESVAEMIGFEVAVLSVVLGPAPMPGTPMTS